jgi:hypothetical protein
MPHFENYGVVKYAEWSKNTQKKDDIVEKIDSIIVKEKKKEKVDISDISEFKQPYMSQKDLDREKLANMIEKLNIENSEPYKNKANQINNNPHSGIKLFKNVN